MQKTEEEKYNIKTVLRCFKILEYVAKHGGPVVIQDVCKELGINSNMAFRMLSTLVSTGYLEKDTRGGGYLVSLKSLSLSRRALQSAEIRRLSMPYLELLWNQFPKANANLGVKYGNEIMILDRIDTLSAPRTYFTPGKVLPFYCTALGKVLACDLPKQELDELMSTTKFIPYTAHTIVEPKLIRAELEKVRAEGVGRDRDEFIIGDNCTACPIQKDGGQIVAAIGLSALTDNMNQEEIEAAIPRIKETASRISSLLGYTRVI